MLLRRAAPAGSLLLPLLLVALARLLQLQAAKAAAATATPATAAPGIGGGEDPAARSMFVGAGTVISTGTGTQGGPQRAASSSSSSMAHHSQPPAVSFDDDEEEEAREPYILLVKGPGEVELLRRLCGGAGAGAGAGVGGSGGDGAAVDDDACGLGPWRQHAPPPHPGGGAGGGVCRHFYTTLLHGVAGSFSRRELGCLRRRLGGGLLRLERDGRVFKAEGPDPAAAAAAAQRRLRGRQRRHLLGAGSTGSHGEGVGWGQQEGGADEADGADGVRPAASAAKRSRVEASDQAQAQAQAQRERRRRLATTEHERFQVDGRPESVPAEARSSGLLWQLAQEAQAALRAAAAAAAAAATAATAMAVTPHRGGGSSGSSSSSSEGAAADSSGDLLHGMLGGAVVSSAQAAAGHGSSSGSLTTMPHLLLPFAHILTMEQSTSGVTGDTESGEKDGGKADAGAHLVAAAAAAAVAADTAIAADGAWPSVTTAAKTPDPSVSTGQRTPPAAAAASQPPDAASVDLRRYAAADAAAMQQPALLPGAVAATAAVAPGGDGLLQPQALLQPRPLLREVPVDVALWHLDRIDQRAPPLDGLYGFGPGTGAGVTIYALDSGVYAQHDEFQSWGGGGGAGGGGGTAAMGRASYGHDFVDGDSEAADCDGHGTHVASTALGRSVGVARGAALVAVRVLDCGGSGSIADTVAGLDWLAKNVKRPAVAMLSLGVPAGDWSRVLGEAVSALVSRHGVPVVAASGNAAVDSCGITPANLPEVITVAASNLEGKFNASARRPPPTSSPMTAPPSSSPLPAAPPPRELMYSWSNTGKCVDLFAPGVEIFGACGGKDRCAAVTPSAYTWASGTSMAVPSVAGAAALYLEAHPDASPRQVADALVRGATPAALHDPRMRPGTPNRLLYSRLNYLGPELQLKGADDVSAAEGPSGL
ncbi:hypothetical protein HYH02_005555 [Chlamydomonas schloesseri]|uniref:Peptidase S8/S53 domain-containing protein n=1 Tax=Chlamydomonas schloesseri TaxID=2026947 RepID=A0A836B6V5_9CHLO|nr:hypothetical protein HYH02_005555 [Chlamydomonas schloesseri]|eukprot:KAG2449406.1 hypothetical protein HYH02_005555 [Chlamydomonas schloesseri]